MIYSGSHSSIYFLIILTYSNLVGHAVNSNLYSEFNNGLDKMSNYAENRVKEETSPTLEEIYNHNENILWKHLDNIPLENVWNANKFSEIPGIEKLINVLSPYHEPLQNRPDISSYLASRNSRAKSCRGKIQDSPAKYEHVKNKRDLALNRGRWSRRSEKSLNDELALKGRIQSKRMIRKKRLGMLSKRYDPGFQITDPKSLLNTAPSMYPNVIANTLDVSALSNMQGLPAKVPSISTPIATADNNDLANSVNQIREIQNALFASQQQSPPLQTGSESSIPLRFPIGVNELLSRSPPGDQQPKPVAAPAEAAAAAGLEDGSTFDADNIKNVLEKVISELENFRQCKGNSNVNTNSTPEGTACNVMGSWNSEVVGLRFDISTSESKGVNVELQERCPAKRHAWMDPDWICTGGALKKMGGPIYIIAEKPEENTLATFSGLCKVCGGTDTVFGSWTIVHPAKDCQDMQLAVETKRDIFRRNLLPDKKKERLNLIKKLTRGCKKPTPKTPCNDNFF